MEKIILLIAVLMIVCVFYPLIIDEFKHPHDWGDRELDFCLNAHMECNQNFVLMDCMECDAYKRGRCIGWLKQPHTVKE